MREERSRKFLLSMSRAFKKKKKKKMLMWIIQKGGELRAFSIGKNTHAANTEKKKKEISDVVSLLFLLYKSL